MVLDSGNMERMSEKYFDSPCINCTHIQNDFEYWEQRCPFFKDGIIPEDIVSGKNKHTERHSNQIKDGLFNQCWFF